MIINLCKTFYIRKTLTNNVQYIYLLIQEASRGDGVGLPVGITMLGKVVKRDQNN